MKLISLIIIAIVMTGCNATGDKPGPVKQTLAADSISYRQFYPREIFADSNLINTSGHKLIVLYNAVANFFPVTDSADHRLPTECLYCEPLQLYNNHLVFARQFELGDSTVIRHEKELNIPVNAPVIQRTGSNGRTGKSKRFTFSEGWGKIIYVKHSCNDAELNILTLMYKGGKLTIKNVLNAEFFEFDSNKDGNQEQYIMATRNCSQELAILKID